MWIHWQRQTWFPAILIGAALLLGQSDLGLAQSSNLETVEPTQEAAGEEGLQTQIKISPETTVLTQPLDDRGYLNVGQAVNG